MKPSSVFVVSIVLSGAAVSAQTPRVRPLDPVAAMAFAQGHEKSETFRALVAELEASDLIVHVVTAVGLPGGVAGTTRFAGSLGGARYVRIDLAGMLIARQRVSILAHELQHACEIARSGAGSSGAIDALYRGIGTTATIPGGSKPRRPKPQAGRCGWSWRPGTLGRIF
jgi:hypothetical protein